MPRETSIEHAAHWLQLQLSRVLAAHLGPHGEVEAAVVVLGPDELQLLPSKGAHGGSNESNISMPGSLQRACRFPSGASQAVLYHIPHPSKPTNPPGTRLACAPRSGQGWWHCGCGRCGRSCTAPAPHGTPAARPVCLPRGSGSMLQAFVGMAHASQVACASRPCTSAAAAAAMTKQHNLSSKSMNAACLVRECNRAMLLDPLMTVPHAPCVPGSSGR